MSIIPDPGPAPQEEPIEEAIVLPGNDEYTVEEDEVIHLVGDVTVFNAFNSTIINNGTIWLESNQVHGWLVTGGISQVENTGFIYIHGESQVELSPEINRLDNSGTIYVIADDGTTRAVQTAGPDPVVNNSGLLVAQNLGADSEFGAIAVTATTLTLTNSADGQILAEAVNFAVGISTSAQSFGNHDLVTNAGLIVANATAEDGISVGIDIVQPGFGVQKIINSGTIRADFAIFATSSSQTVENPQEHVQNLAGGVIEGFVFLGIGDDTITNDGSMIGDVDMGAGDDVFSGSGTVSGVIDMGFGADTYTGSGHADRTDGGRGDDTITGRGGNDLLLGGFGDDFLRGDAGNDGLFGEWGDDTIITRGGDYVEGNSGDDRVIVQDYTFASLNGGSGFDTLELASGARNFSLAEMLDGNRISGFEAIALTGNQQLAVDLASAAALAGKDPTLVIEATASDTVHLAEGWTRGDDTTLGDETYQRWEFDGATVLVAAAANVQTNSAPAFGGFDAIASGDAAPLAGEDSDLDYTQPETFLRFFVLFDEPFTVAAEETFFTDSFEAFYAEDPDAQLNNFGRILALDNDASATNAVNFEGRGVLNNFGEIYAEQTAEPGTEFIFHFPSVAVQGGGSFETGPLENYGEIGVYSVPGSAIAVNNLFGGLVNQGLIYAISENSRAIGANGINGEHPADYVQSFFNTGRIIAIAGGTGPQNFVGEDRIVPEIYAATGISSVGSLVNDGEIIALLSDTADQSLLTVGIYAQDYFHTSDQPAEITNNGLIIGVEAIVFEGNDPNISGNAVINNGVIDGNIQFNSGNDNYDGNLGQMFGTVFGREGNDTFTGGNFADRFNGGLGDDALDGGSNVDTAVVSGNRADYTLTQTSTGVWQVVGADGTDTLTAIEYLQFDDELLRLLPGTGVSVTFEGAAQNSYQTVMEGIRDFDGNDLGGDGSWLWIGAADVNGDGDVDQLLVNQAIGRFATVGTAEDGLVYFEDHSWAGETRVAGIYIDPLVQSGEVVQGSDFDSQRRFQNDLEIVLTASVASKTIWRSAISTAFWALKTMMATAFRRSISRSPMAPLTCAL